MNPEIIHAVRKKTPLIHHLTNQVVLNFSANGMLSFGAVPVMAKATEEVAEMASISDGVLINIGTLMRTDIDTMILAGKTANKKGIPVVFDPVGISATKFRSEAAQQILKTVKPTVIKGNTGEMAHLVNIPWKTKGVESVGEGNTKAVAEKVAWTYKTNAVVTGKTDFLCTKNGVAINDTGHPYLTKVTGAGCLLGAVLTACLTTKHPIDEKIKTALTFFGLAASYAAKQPGVQGTGTFMPHFIDALSLDAEHLEGKIDGSTN